MHAGTALQIRIALLDAPDNVLDTLSGIVVRQFSAMQSQQPQEAVRENAWQSQCAVHSQQMRLSIEGLVHDAVAGNYLRKAALLALPVRCEITWPGLGSSDGQFGLRRYEEFADAENVLRFEAELLSSNAPSITIGS